MAGDETEGGNLAILDQLGEAVTAAVTGLPPQVQRSFWKAFGRVLNATVEWPARVLEGKARVAGARSSVEVARYEVKAAAIRSEQKNKDFINKESVKVAARQFEREDLANRALEYHASHIIREQVRREEILQIAVEDIADNPPVIDSLEEIEDDVLESILREGCQRSSAEFKILFGRILAGEIKRPGSFSIGTIQSLGRLDQITASLFSTFCNISFALTLQGKMVLLPRIHTCSLGSAGENSLARFGLSYADLARLAEEGLVRSELGETVPFPEIFYNINVVFEIGGERFWTARDLTVPDTEKATGALSFEGPAMTKAGIELRQIVTMTASEDYLKVLAGWFKSKKIVLYKAVSEEGGKLNGRLIEPEQNFPAPNI